MTAPSSPGLGRPAKAAGVLLLGIAVIALVIGLITLFGGGSGDDEAGPAPTPTTTGTVLPPGTTSSLPAPTTSSAKPPVTTTSAKPPVTTTSKAPPPASTPNPGGGAPATRAQPVRIYNNSTIKGLAARASDDFRKGGWHVVEVGNYSQGIIATATVYYRPGTGEEAAAREMAKTYGMRVEPRFAGIQSASAGVIVIVTNDYTGKPGKG